mgnify:FL=1|jgi:hypothetical protein|tara:strand:- start:1030 stop:1959 length:930 start_codon:yes stop_codon:yes gene_type:complete
MPIYAQSSTLRTLLIPLVDIDQTTIANEDLLQYNSTTGKFENKPLSSGGAAVITTASNVGTGATVFKQKTLQNLEFKSITAGAGITLVANANDVEISSTGVLDTASNLGAGQEVFSSKVAGDFQFRTINEGIGNINFTVSTVANEIRFVNTAEINTASNRGGGATLFAAKTGADLEFKSIIAGNNITVTSDANEVTINSQAQIQDSSAYQITAAFDGNGNLQSISDLPAGWISAVVGNKATITHTENKMVKNITYWGKDATLGWQLRFPNAGFQATVPVGSENSKFIVDLNASVAGADTSSTAKINVIF